jgi:phosphopantetheinyl transferase
MRAAEVRVWTAFAHDLGQADEAALGRLLAADERERASRFRFDADRRGYVLAHALRRCVLGRSLATHPADLRFHDDTRGQPALLGAPRPIFFSHARNRTAVAVAMTEAGPLGVDIEAIDASRADPALLSRLVAHSDAADFFVQWTVVEAFWKASGTGLADGNPRIRLEREGEGEGQFLVREGESALAPAAGRAVAITSLAGLSIAVAIRGPGFVPEIRHFHCSCAMEINQLCNDVPSHEQLGHV